ncbi:MAG: pilus assembly protein N-terminal domain-containing protein [Pseudomonadota bacterium]
MFKRFFTLAVIAGLSMAGSAATTTTASAEASGIQVSLNQARVIKLSRAAGTVIVGNPAIADASIGDAQTIVLTGRGFGRTNLVILDERGNPVFDEQVSVGRDEDVLRIYRRSNIETLSCTPFCENAYLTPAEERAIEARTRANLFR